MRRIFASDYGWFLDKMDEEAIKRYEGLNDESKKKARRQLFGVHGSTILDCLEVIRLEQVREASRFHDICFSVGFKALSLRFDLPTTTLCRHIKKMQRMGVLRHHRKNDVPPVNVYIIDETALGYHILAQIDGEKKVKDSTNITGERKFLKSKKDSSRRLEESITALHSEMPKPTPSTQQVSEKSMRRTTRSTPVAKPSRENEGFGLVKPITHPIMDYWLTKEHLPKPRIGSGVYLRCIDFFQAMLNREVGPNKRFHIPNEFYRNWSGAASQHFTEKLIKLMIDRLDQACSPGHTLHGKHPKSADSLLYYQARDDRPSGSFLIPFAWREAESINQMHSRTMIEQADDWIVDRLIALIEERRGTEWEPTVRDARQLITAAESYRTWWRNLPDFDNDVVTDNWERLSDVLDDFELFLGTRKQLIGRNDPPAWLAATGSAFERFLSHKSSRWCISFETGESY